MSNIPKFGPAYHINNHLITDNKLRPSTLIQPSAQKTSVFQHPSPIIPSPPTKQQKPEIIQPNLISKMTALPKKTVSRSHSFSLNAIEKPLDLIEQTPHKQRQSRRHRNSCSQSDISWSPNMIINNDNIRQRKMSNLSESHASPLCSQDYED